MSESTIQRVHPGHVLITGGSSGIGLALARRYAEEGYDITIIARTRETLDAAATALTELCKRDNQRILALSADVSDQEAVTKAIEQAISELGAPEYLVTSAGFAHPGLFHELPIELFERTMAINYFGTLYAIRAALPAMRLAGRGRIVMISSGAALVGIYGYTPYSPTKFALRGLAESLRGELRFEGIGVTIVYPPDTDTPQLAYETQFKPRETQLITGSAAMWSAEAVADSILKKIRRKAFVVAPGWEMGLLARVHSLINPAVQAWFDLLASKGRKERLAEEPESKTTNWLALISFMFVICMSQALWLNFAAINDTVTQSFHVTQLQASYLTIVFPLFFTVFSIPSGIVIDKYGYRSPVLVSTAIMAIAASIRLIPGSFYWLLIGQVIIASAQAFIVNSIPKLVGAWFANDSSALATSLATGGFFIGMLIGLGLSPVLTGWIGMSGMLLFFALLCWVSLFLFIRFPTKKAFEEHQFVQSDIISFDKSSVLTLMKRNQFMLLMMLSFLAVGVFNALMTWMQPILSENHITQDQAGMVGAVVILGGIIGSIVFSMWSDKHGRRKPFLLSICLFATVLIYLFTTCTSFNDALFYGGLLGLIFLPGYALLLTVVEEMVEKRLAGTATGLVMMIGNGGGVVLGILLEKIHSTTHHWLTSDIVMVGLLMVAFLALFALKEPRLVSSS